ncbi:MAG: response regulator [Lyngbya sp.]|nr:response regulator [Lyngbya sp.]
MPKSKLKLMVVDDEQDNLDLIYRTFRRHFPIFLADSPASAMKILDVEGEMAIIISDQSMPEMTGIEFLSKISARFPNTIRILLTGYAEDALEDDPEIIKAAQIFKCVTKPWDPENLRAIVQQAAEVYQTSLQ